MWAQARHAQPFRGRWPPRPEAPSGGTQPRRGPPRRQKRRRELRESPHRPIVALVSPIEEMQRWDRCRLGSFSTAVASEMSAVGGQVGGTVHRAGKISHDVETGAGTTLEAVVQVCLEGL